MIKTFQNSTPANQPIVKNNESVNRVNQYTGLLIESINRMNLYGLNINENMKPVILNRLKGIMYVESRGKKDAISPTGATGLMQVIKSTFNLFKKAYFPQQAIYYEDMKQPEKNILVGTMVFSENYRNTKSLDRATKIYFAGYKWENAGTPPPGNTITGNQYLNKVLQAEQFFINSIT